MNISFTNIELGLYNMLSCKGFETADSLGLSFGPCAQAKIGMVLLFFITAITRKWGGEEIGLDFSFPGGLIGGLLSYFMIISILGSFKIALVVGLVGMALGGYLGGSIFGGEEYE